MKRSFILILALVFCLLAVVPAASAENNVAKYEQLLTGTWKLVWRYLPQTAMQLNKLSDQVKPVNLFVFPGEQSRPPPTHFTLWASSKSSVSFLVYSYCF